MTDWVEAMKKELCWARSGEQTRKSQGPSGRNDPLSPGGGREWMRKWK